MKIPEFNFKISGTTDDLREYIQKAVKLFKKIICKIKGEK